MIDSLAQTKICTKCNTEKSVSEFYTRKDLKSGLESQCKKCIILRKKEYRKANPSITANYNAEYKYRKPWVQTYRNVWNRCYNPRCKTFSSYGGRGVKMYMILGDFEFLWHRDAANQMDKPSIDRLNSDSHYTVLNCRYMELRENIASRVYGREMGAVV